MNVRQLQYFVKIVEAGNFTRASRELHVSQPALGQQIKMLEDSCRLELLTRHSRGIRPTAAGSLLYDRATEILKLIAGTQQELRDLAQASADRLRIGLVRSLIRQLGANLLLDASELMPGVKLHITEDFSVNLLPAIRRNEIDLALVYHIDSEKGVELRPILNENYVLVSRRDEYAPVEQDIRLKDTLAHKLVFHASYDFVRTALEDAAARYALPLNIAFEAHSAEALFDSVGCGLASAIAPYGMMENMIRSRKAVARRIVDPEIIRTLYVAQPPQRLRSSNRRAVEEFIARICGRIQESLRDFSIPVDACTENAPMPALGRDGKNRLRLSDEALGPLAYVITPQR